MRRNRRAVWGLLGHLVVSATLIAWAGAETASLATRVKPQGTATVAFHSFSKEAREEMLLSGEAPSPTNPPSGCRFHPRCPLALTRCAQETPPLRELAPAIRPPAICIDGNVRPRASCVARRVVVCAAITLGRMASHASAAGPETLLPGWLIYDFLADDDRDRRKAASARRLVAA
jgi:oligopeptide/dipeptide ABC transporter ATP-binding protein